MKKRSLEILLIIGVILIILALMGTIFYLLTSFFGFFLIIGIILIIIAWFNWEARIKRKR